jgi:hypothetical protein
MLAAIAPYLAALLAMTFAAVSALTIIYSVNRFDPPGADTPAGKGAAPAAAEKPHDIVAA